jgi:hypothetical protein
LDDLTEKRQQYLDQVRKNILSDRRAKELMELEEDSKRPIVKDDLGGRESGKRCNLKFYRIF